MRLLAFRVGPFFVSMRPESDCADLIVHADLRHGKLLDRSVAARFRGRVPGKNRPP